MDTSRFDPELRDPDAYPGEIKVQVTDEGRGFDPSQVPDPTDPANLERPCGRGLLLMRAFVDPGELVAISVRSRR